MDDYTSPYIPDVSFTPEDAASNRQGKLTPSQEEMLTLANMTRRRDARKVTIGFLLFFAGLLVIGAIIEYARQPVSLDQFVVRQAPIFGLMVVGMLVLLGVAFVGGYLVGGNLRNRRISVAEGAAQLRTSAYDDLPVFPLETVQSHMRLPRPAMNCVLTDKAASCTLLFVEHACCFRLWA